MKLLNMPSSLFTAGVLATESDSSKRIVAVKAFYEHPQTPQLLRRACLCLRLTLFAVSLTAQKSSIDKPREPIMVRLGRGEVETRTATLFTEIVRSLPNDPELDRDDALCGLLLTQAHTVIRFNQHRRLLAQVWKLTRKFNPVGYAAEIVDCFALGQSSLRRRIFFVAEA